MSYIKDIYYLLTDGTAKTQITDGTNVLGTIAHPIIVSGSFTPIDISTLAKEGGGNLDKIAKIADSVAGIAASENHVGEVGGSSAQVVASPTVALTAYNGTPTAPVCVGGVMTFTNAMRKSGGTGILQSIDLVDIDVIKSPLILVIFNQNPINGTYTDKSVPSFGTDAANIIRALPINTSDYQQLNASFSIADLSPGSRMLSAVGSANLYGILLTIGTPTFVHNNALSVKLGIMRD